VNCKCMIAEVKIRGVLYDENDNRDVTQRAIAM